MTTLNFDFYEFLKTFLSTIHCRGHFYNLSSKEKFFQIKQNHIKVKFHSFFSIFHFFYNIDQKKRRKDSSSDHCFERLIYFNFISSINEKCRSNFSNYSNLELNVIIIKFFIWFISSSLVISLFENQSISNTFRNIDHNDKIANRFDTSV